MATGRKVLMATWLGSTGGHRIEGTLSKGSMEGGYNG